MVARNASCWTQDPPVTSQAMSAFMASLVCAPHWRASFSRIWSMWRLSNSAVLPVLLRHYGTARRSMAWSETAASGWSSVHVVGDADHLVRALLRHCGRQAICCRPWSRDAIADDACGMSNIGGLLKMVPRVSGCPSFLSPAAACGGWSACRAAVVMARPAWC